MGQCGLGGGGSADVEEPSRAPPSAGKEAATDVVAGQAEPVAHTPAAKHPRVVVDSSGNHVGGASEGSGPEPASDAAEDAVAAAEVAVPLNSAPEDAADGGPRPGAELPEVNPVEVSPRAGDSAVGGAGAAVVVEERDGRDGDGAASERDAARPGSDGEESERRTAEYSEAETTSPSASAPATKEEAPTDARAEPDVPALPSPAMAATPATPTSARGAAGALGASDALLVAEDAADVAPDATPTTVVAEAALESFETAAGDAEGSHSAALAAAGGSDSSDDDDISELPTDISVGVKRLRGRGPSAAAVPAMQADGTVVDDGGGSVGEARKAEPRDAAATSDLSPSGEDVEASEHTTAAAPLEPRGKTDPAIEVAARRSPGAAVSADASAAEAQVMHADSSTAGDDRAESTAMPLDVGSPHSAVASGAADDAEGEDEGMVAEGEDEEMVAETADRTAPFASQGRDAGPPNPSPELAIVAGERAADMLKASGPQDVVDGRDASGGAEGTSDTASDMGAQPPVSLAATSLVGVAQAVVASTRVRHKSSGRTLRGGRRSRGTTRRSSRGSRGSPALSSSSVGSIGSDTRTMDDISIGVGDAAAGGAGGAVGEVGTSFREVSSAERVHKRDRDASANGSASSPADVPGGDVMKAMAASGGASDDESDDVGDLPPAVRVDTAKRLRGRGPSAAVVPAFNADGTVAALERVESRAEEHSSSETLDEDNDSVSMPPRLGEDYDPLVISFHGFTCSVGTGSSVEPISTFPSVVGRPSGKGMYVAAWQLEESVWVGNDALRRGAVLTMRQVKEDDHVSSFDDWELLVHHAVYTVAGKDPEEHPLVLTEAFDCAKSERERMTQIAFDTFNVPALLLASPPQLAMFSRGQSTGLSVYQNDKNIWCVPMFEGYVLEAGVRRMPLGSTDLDYAFHRLLMIGESNTDGAVWNTLNESQRELARRIFAETNRAALDFDGELAELQTAGDGHSYTLPDGNELMLLDGEHLRATELLFRPSAFPELFSGKDVEGLPAVVHEAIAAVDVDLRDSLYRNIVLSGDLSRINGVEDRLVRELRTGAGAGHGTAARARVFKCGPDAVFEGATVAAHSFRSTYWITREDYEERGAYVSHAKALVNCG